MSMLIQHNMMAWNAERQFNIVTKAKDKKAEKLSSGYRINRAADDAAGLSISEKMRRQIRGLKVGTENAQMGISWVQIGEGALNEAHDILHRMNELSIKAQNGTNTLVDRAYMEAEFEQLQSELDRISTTTTFNELNIFEEHEPVYDQISGNIDWDYEEYHEILDGKNDLTITYRTAATDQAQVMTISVAAGRYTTHELIDAIDDAFGVDSPIHMEFTEKGFCRLNLEGGEVMDSVTGGLTYLLWDNYDGGGYGTLIGTTSFYDHTTPILDVVKGQNDKMEFWIEYFDHDEKTNPHPPEKITIDLLAASGGMTKDTLSKNEVMKRINDQITAQSPNSGLKADHHGESIQLASPDGIVTGFKGNMFKMEIPGRDPKTYHGAFYDNIREGYVWQDPAFVVGGAVLTTDTRDKEHNRYYIDGTNDTLVLYPNPKTSSKTGPTTIKITHNTTDGYDAAQMVKELNDQFKAAGIDGEVRAHLVRSKYRDPFPNQKKPDGSGTATAESVGDTSVIFEGVEIRTVKEGPDAIVNFAKVKDANNKDTNQVDKTLSTAYDTLFTTKEWNDYSLTANDAKVNNQTRADVNAAAYSAGTWASTDKVTIKNNVNDRFKITMTSKNKNGGPDFTYTKTFDLCSASEKSKSMSAAAIVGAINKQIEADSTLKGRLVAEVGTEGAQKGKIVIRDKEDLTLDNVNDDYMNWTTSISIENDGNNAGYRDIFQEKYYYYVPRTVSGNGSLTLDVSKKNGNSLVVYIDGVETTFDITGTTAGEIKASMDKTTPKKFTSVSGEGTTSVRNVNASGAGATTVTPWAADKDTGTSKEHEGRPGVYANQPAQLAIGPGRAYLCESDGKTLKKNIVIDDTNNTISININGQGMQELKLDNKTYATADDLAENLQLKIDEKFGDATGWGRATVDVKGGQFVLTCTIPKGKKGEDTSIQSSNDPSKNKFFAALNTTKSAARAVSNQTLNAGDFTLTEGVNDTFSFTFDDGSGPKTVNVDLIKGATVTPTTTRKFNNGAEAVAAINTELAAMGVKVSAKVENDRMVLTSTDKGAGISISYNGNGGGNSIDDGIFGLSKETTASVTLDRAVVGKTTFDGTKRFSFVLDNKSVFVDIGKWDNGSSKTSDHLDRKLNAAFDTKGLDVKAEIVNGKLRLTKKTSGSGNLSISYDSSNGSVMGDMFGYEPKPNVTVTANNTKKTITITATGKQIRVPSGSSSGLVQPTKVTAYADAYETGGWHDADYSTLTSTVLDANGYELNRWNNDFKFCFTEDGGKTYKEYSVTLPTSAAGQKTTLSDIKDQLQSALDTAMGGKKIEVLLDTNNRLSLKSAKPGAQFRFLTGNQTATVGGKTVRGLQSDSADDGEVGGGFFHHVMCRRTPKKNDFADRTDINGEQFADDVYAMGRHDVVFDRASLHPGISDTLILDLNYIADKNHDGKLDDAEKNDMKVITLELKPKTKVEDWLTSSDKEVLATLREQINEAIDRWNAGNGIQLNKGMIEVDIGKHDTGVYGNKDKVAVSFTMTKDPDIATPAEGYFYIDGIRGNAAYETFYHTEGELIPAYIVGTKDISKGVTLGKDDNELVFLVDGEMKRIDLSKLDKNRTISAEEIIQTITNQFQDQGLHLAASITQKGAIKISYDKMGLHSIEQVTGSARNKLFFEEHTAKRMSNERDIRVSSFEGDRLSVYSPRFSTAMLGINSICISTIKNAEKATNRLKEAIRKVSDMRSTFGAIQNRFEHTVNNNLNKHENLQAAESRIRDADISKEMMDFSNLSIIQQAGQAVLAQANQSRNAMLTLLG